MHSQGPLRQPDILDQGHRQVDLDHQEDQHLAAIEVHPQEEEDLGVADALPMTMDMAHAHTLDLYHQDLDGDPVRVLDHLLAVHLDDVEVHQVGVRRDEEDEVPVTVPGAALVAVDREAEAEVVHAAETDRAAGGRWEQIYSHFYCGVCLRRKDTAVSTEIDP